MRLQPFCVLRDGEPIESVPLRFTVRTGISPNDVRLDLGMISEYEEREAALFIGSSWKAWQKMEMSDRAAAVAHMRYHALISSHVHDVIEKSRKKKQ